MNALPTIAGLVLALAGPPLLAVASTRLLSSSSSVAGRLPFDIILWAILAVVLMIAFINEKQTLASIGFNRPLASTIFWAALLVVGFTFILQPALIWAVHKSGLGGYERGLPPLLNLPTWYRVFLGLSAGIIEEALYRGYAVTRLASLSGSYWIGGSIAVVAFGLAHIPLWGLGLALVTLVDGAILTLFYVWKRDLVALMIAHATGDIIGLGVFTAPIK